MKNFSLARKIATIGSLLSSVAAVVFIILAVNQSQESVAMSGNVNNPKVITPRSMGAYGELMFSYIGENNYLYDLDDESVPLVCDRASELLYASDDSILYIVPCELSASHGGRESIIRELQVEDNGNVLNTIAAVTMDPCWSSNDEVIYYVEDSSPTVLRSFEPLQSAKEIAAEFDREIKAIRVSSDGLLVTLADEAEALFVPLSRQLVQPVFDYTGKRITICEQYDLLLSSDGRLEYHWQGAENAVMIADSVLAAISYQDNEIYYISQSSHGISLNMYVVSEDERHSLIDLPDNLLPQLTNNSSYALVMDEDGVVYRYDFELQTLIPYHVVDLSTIKSPLISLFDYRLMVYDLSREPDRSYCYAVPAETQLSEEEVKELNVSIYGMDANTDRAEFPDLSYLSVGSMGEEVLQLQSKLYGLGYMLSDPNGFYDVPTFWAVLEAQHSIGFPETGTANRQFQSAILNDEVVPFSADAPIGLDDRGVRIRNTQSRLKTLGYYASEINEEFNEDAVYACKLFAETHGINWDAAQLTSEFMNTLSSLDESGYNGYISLYPDMNSEQVFSLNKRLMSLGYLAVNPSPQFDGETVKALVLFCSVNTVHNDATATPNMQELLFSDTAMACPEELRPASFEKAISATPGQVISDRELKILRKWLTKSYAVNHTDKQAVKRLQKQLVRIGFLEEDNISMVYDQKTADAMSKFQEENEMTPDGIPSKKTLMALFGIGNAVMSGE